MVARRWRWQSEAAEVGGGRCASETRERGRAGRRERACLGTRVHASAWRMYCHSCYRVPSGGYWLPVLSGRYKSPERSSQSARGSFTSDDIHSPCAIAFVILFSRAASAPFVSGRTLEISVAI